MKQNELNEILRLHNLWLNGDSNGKRADLYGANLYRANLWRANLRGANLCGANLYEADLLEANLCGADLWRANLRGANLRGANLCGADLYEADLRGTNLRGADLCGANLREAEFRGANLYRVKNVPYIPLECPSDGCFVGWKKIDYKCLIKLEIPEDAKRSSATTKKCRCSKAKVLGIYNLDGTESELTSVINDNYAETTYTVGEMVYPDSFDEDRWNECSHGIHFFANKQDAINY